MKRYKVGIIRVLTTKDPEVLLSHENILKSHFECFDLETRCIPDQQQGVHDETTYDEALPKIIELAKKWEKDVDGIIISCAGDPGVKELRDVLKIPVVGAGHSVASLSRNYGRRVGVIGIENEVPGIFHDILKDSFLGYEKPNGVNNTNDLLREDGEKAIMESARKLKDRGADVLAFACTGLSTAEAYKLLKVFDLPIVDGVIAEGTVMLNKLIESKMKAYES